MNSHFQSRETTWMRTGLMSDGDRASADELTADVNLIAGSSSWEPIHATPLSRMTTIAGMDHTTSSMRPEYAHSGS
jgi:hypothetical protein